MNRFQYLSFCLTGFLLLAVVVSAQVPGRTVGMQTLEVPEEQLDLGLVYYLWPGEDTQIAMTSEAPLQRLIATQSRMVGYVVAPFDPDGEESPILAGALRLPTAMLRTGSSQADDAITGPDLFDAAGHPEMTFVVTGVKDASLVSQEAEGDITVYDLVVFGALAIKGVSSEVEVPMRATFMLSSNQTMNRYVGDMLTLAGSFELALGDFELDLPHPSFEGRLATVFDVDLFLMFNTVTPDKTLDPSVSAAAYDQENRFLTLLRDLDDPDTGYALGRQYLAEAWDDAQALNRVAWTLLTTPDIEVLDFSFVLEAAERANELRERKDPYLLDTLARVHYRRGDLAAAVATQTAAVALADGLPPRVADQLREELERYRAARGEE